MDEQLKQAVEWVLNDAHYKAPEQIGIVAQRWIDKLKQALAAPTCGGAQREGGQAKVGKEVWVKGIVTSLDAGSATIKFANSGVWPYEANFSLEALAERVLASPPSGEPGQWSKPENGLTAQKVDGKWVPGAPDAPRDTSYPGQEFFHAGNTNIRLAEENFAARASVESGERLTVEQVHGEIQKLAKEIGDEFCGGSETVIDIVEAKLCSWVYLHCTPAGRTVLATPAPSEGKGSARDMADEYEHARHCPVCGSRLDPRQDLRAPLHAWEQRGYERGLEAGHVNNEWADMAANGLQWLKNVRDGISNPDEAIAEMESNYDRIRALAERGKGDPKR